MARISVTWEEPSLGGGYEGFNPEDVKTGLPDQYRESEKPVIFYLASDLTEDYLETQNIDNTVLRDEKVAIGMKMFDLVKVDGSKITKTHPFAKILGGRELPRMVVVGGDGSKVGHLEGNVPPSKLFGLMKRATGKVYKTKPESFIKEYQKILTEIDKVEAAKQALAATRAADNDPSKAKIRKWEVKEAEIAADEQKLAAQEQELLAFKMRESKVAKGNP